MHSPAATIAGTIGLEKYSSSPLYVLNGGLIYGIEAAVYNQGGLLTITNQTSGTIIATATANPAGYLGGNFLTLGVGIRTEYQTAVYNYGLISGSRVGIEDAGAFSYFYNHASGTINGGAGYGVVLEFGNVITNLGTISGYRDGVKAVYFAANVNNSGVVSASGVTFVTGGPGHGAGLAPGSYGIVPHDVV